MNLSEIILTALIIFFIAAIIFIKAVKSISGYKKVTGWVLISLGFISYFSLLFSIFTFFVNGLISKGIMPILSISLLFILPLTAISAFIGIDSIKAAIRNFVK